MNIIWALRGDKCWWAWDLDVTPVPVADTPIDVIALLPLPVQVVKIKWSEPARICTFQEYGVSYMTLEEAKSFAEAQYCLMK